MLGTYSKATRILITALVAALLLILCAMLLPTPAQAATEGDFIYESSYGTASIIGYTGSGGDVAIPDTLGGYPTTYIGDSAFEGCISLTSVTIPGSVTRIDDSAFRDCVGLTSVTIPNSVTYIGGSAFYYCTGLTSVTIPDSVTYIGRYAFYYCSNLTSVTIPKTVAEIGMGAFYGCSGLTGIWVDNKNPQYCSDTYGVLFDKDKSRIIKAPSTLTDTYVIPDGVTSIDEEAFYHCSSLASVTIPDSVTDIGDSAFYYCTGLTSVTIGDSVTHIGDYAFYCCSNLTSVTIPDGVTELGNSTFSGCENLTSVILPAEMRDLGDGTFADCSSLASVTIPQGVERLGTAVFSRCNDLRSLTIPDSVRTIGQKAFFYCTGLKSVTIGKGVERIGAMAFYSCNGLVAICIKDPSAWCNIEFEDGDAFPQYYADELHIIDEQGNLVDEIVLDYRVRRIPEYAFSDCVNRAVVIMSDSVVHIGQQAFRDATGLTGVVLGDVYTIESRAFWGCTGLTSVQLSDHLKTIEKMAFWGCTNLGTVTIPDTVTTIGEYAFFNCGSMESLVLPDGLTSIEEGTFAECGGLKTVTLGKYVSSIGTKAFAECRSMVSINLPDGVSVIGERAFYFCDSLASVEIPSAAMIKAWAFYGCSSLTAVTIPEGVMTVEEYAFSSCRNLTSVTIPESAINIGYRAFAECDNLTAVTIPVNMSLIFHQAFRNCNKLSDVYYAGSLEQLNQLMVGEYNDPLIAAKAHCNHVHSYAMTKTVSATCTAGGYKEYTCEYGERYRDAIPALGHAMTDGVCANCGLDLDCDYNADGAVTDADAIYLLRYTLFPGSYLLNEYGDVNGDGSVTDGDAVYLLRHTLFGGSYPLFPFGKVPVQPEKPDLGEGEEIFDANILSFPTSSRTITMGTGVAYIILTPSYKGSRELTWSSSDPSVATVGKTGYIYPVNLGKTVITVTDGVYSAKCNVTVEGLMVTTKIDRYMFVGETLQLDCAYSGNVSALTWSSTSDSVLAVNSSGLLTAKGAGKAAAVVTDGDLIYRFSVTVALPENRTTSVVLSSFDAPLYDGVVKYAGDTMRFWARAKPNVDTKINYTSSDSSVISIEWDRDQSMYAGDDTWLLVKFKKEGTATITVSSEDGCVSHSFTIHVLPKFDFDPNKTELTPEEFAYYANQAAMALGQEKNHVLSTYRYTYIAEERLTWENAIAFGRSLAHDNYRLDIDGVIVTYEGWSDEHNKHLFYYGY